ncbi:oxygenase MpaB family protein [Amycolatopsis sp. NBC_00348]|uniref:oxygenase MpaB family protein n=1 Tax=Amycolatopsis sp. NBC_00348 TaxID=2975956 RepID=UPI002E26CDAA
MTQPQQRRSLSKVDSGNLFRHPAKRTRTALTYLAVATMGTDAERAAYRRGVNRAHAQVHSAPDSPVTYDAIAAAPARRFHRFVTTGFLPPHFRAEMHLTWTSADQRRFDALLRGVGAVVRLSPGPLRRFPCNLCLWDLRRRLRTGRRPF